MLGFMRVGEIIIIIHGKVGFHGACTCCLISTPRCVSRKKSPPALIVMIIIIIIKERGAHL